MFMEEIMMRLLSSLVCFSDLMLLSMEEAPLAKIKQDKSLALWAF